MREAGDVCYADVYRDGTGVVEFVRKEDMTYAVRKLDNTKFRSHEVGYTLNSFLWPELDTVVLTVKCEGKNSGKGVQVNARYLVLVTLCSFSMPEDR
jgi:hypothetical protein